MDRPDDEGGQPDHPAQTPPELPEEVEITEPKPAPNRTPPPKPPGPPHPSRMPDE